MATIPFLVGAMAAALAANTGQAATPNDPELRLCFDETTVTASSKGRPVFVYRYGGDLYKPYVQELYTLGGVNVLRDAPHDHLHHHALMYAMKVNGVNFWEEQNEPGREVHQAFSGVQPFEGWGVHAASFTETVHWQQPDGKANLLLEERVIGVRKDHADYPTRIVWNSTFRLPEGAESAELGGNHYHGLGLRFLVSMDKTGSFLYGSEETGEQVRGDEYLTPGPWCAFAAEADGKPVTVLALAHAANSRPTLWFTMKTPFSYIAATVNLWKEPVILNPEEEFKLTYFIVVWDGHKSREEIVRFLEEDCR